MFESKEQLVHYFLKGYVHLSKKDYGFFNNISNIIRNDKRITSNQNKLCSKLIVKYQRQLTKLGYDIKVLDSLPWDCIVVETLIEYKEAYLSLEDNFLTIKTPYLTSFISYFRRYKNNPYTWDKVSRFYVAEYSTVSLKIAYETLHKFFETVNYCDNVKKLLEYAKEYDNCIWEPTLVRVGNEYYIAAVNETLFNNTLNIPLNLEPYSVFQISQYGIKTDTKLVQCNPLLEFASKFDTTVDLDNLETIAKWLKILHVDTVFTSRDVIYNKVVSSEIRKVLLDFGLDVKPIQEIKNREGVLLKTSSIHTLFNTDSEFNFVKIIHLTNSRPVHIR